MRAENGGGDEVQDAWLIFQKGDAKKAWSVESFGQSSRHGDPHPWAILSRHAERIVRRTGEYSVASNL